MYQNYQSTGDSHGREMGVKQVDGLQDFKGAIEFTKHQFWSKHRVTVDREIFRVVHDSPRHFAISAVHYRSASKNPAQPRGSGGEASSHFDLSTASVTCGSARPSADAEMVELSKMDSRSLIVAALAPSGGEANHEPRVGNGYSSQGVNFRNISSQTKSPNPLAQSRRFAQLSHPTPRQREAPKESAKRRGRAAGVSPQTLSHEFLLPLSGQGQRNGKGASFRETAATGLGIGSVGPRIVKYSHRSHYFGDSRLRDNNEEEIHAIPLITRQHQRTESPPKRVSSHTISRQELSDLGINPSPYLQKLGSSYSSKNARDGCDEHLKNTTGRSPNGRPCAPLLRSVPARSAKRRRPVVSSNSFNLSSPESSSPWPGKDDEEQEDDDEEEEEEEEEEEDSSERSWHQNERKERPTQRKSGKDQAKKASSSSKRSASAKKRRYNFPVASTLSEASEADKMMFRMKGEGRPWKEITAEWSRMTGRQPGGSSLSVRYIKLKEKFAKMGDPDFARLLRFKRNLEHTFETTEKWDRIADMIVADGGGSYTGQALRSKFKNLVEVGSPTVADGAGNPNAGVGGVDEEGFLPGGRVLAEEVDEDEEEEGEEEGEGSLASLDELDRELIGDIGMDMDGKGSV